MMNGPSPLAFAVFDSPGALWLALPVLLALILLRLYRSRRREILAGSLLIWRRLAAQQINVPPRRFSIDRSLVLQAVTLLSLIVAWAGPSLALGRRDGSTVLLMLDNGPTSRAHLPDGKPVWESVRRAADRRLDQLDARDRVYLAQSSPFPMLISNDALSPADASAQLDKLEAALSGPSADDVWLFAADRSRALSASCEVLSPRAGPAGLDAAGAWQCVAQKTGILSNVAIVEIGSSSLRSGSSAQIQLLARVANFSDRAASGTVELDLGGTIQKLPCELNAGASRAVVFTIDAAANHRAEIRWKAKSDTPDALPEDDVVTATSRAAKSPHPGIRFNAPVPSLNRLYRDALSAEILPRGSPARADLEIFVNSVPAQWPENSNAILLLAPDAGYRSVFDVGGLLTRLQPQRDADHPLTRGIPDSPEGPFAVPRAREILRIGDFSTLIKDRTTGRPLAIAFSDERGRPGFMLAFVPGDGASEDRLLEAPLAALLVRMAEAAAGAGEPFVSTPFREIETQRGKSLSESDRIAALKEGGVGMLDESASRISLGALTDNPARRGGESADSQKKEWDLRLALIILALVCMMVELRSERR